MLAMRARDSNDAPASSRGKDGNGGGGGRENVRAHRGLTITCVKLLSCAVHVSIEDGHHGRARTESSFPRPRRSDLEVRRFLYFSFSLSVGPLSSMFPLSLELCSLFLSSTPLLLSVIIRFNGSDRIQLREWIFFVLFFFFKLVLSTAKITFFLVFIASDIVFFFATFIIFLIRGA